MSGLVVFYEAWQTAMLFPKVMTVVCLTFCLWGPLLAWILEKYIDRRMAKDV